MEGLTYVWGLHNAGNALQMGGVVLGGGVTYVWGLHSADNALPMGRWPTYVWRLHSAVNALPMGGWPTYVWGCTVQAILYQWMWGGPTYVLGVHHSAGNALPMSG